MFEEYRGKKVLVTGGAGFIGSHLCEELVKLGADVYCIDNLTAGKMINISNFLSSSNFHFSQIDVCDKKGMSTVFNGVDIVFHNAASKKNVCLDNPKKDLDVNAGGTLNLLELSCNFGVGKFVHASTGSVYGEPVEFPTTEDHQLSPVSYYGVSKLAGERYVDVFHHLYSLNTTILRYFHVYGTRQESNQYGGVVSIFLRNIKEGKPLIVFGSGKQIRSFTYVKDIIKANLISGISKKAIGQVYNVASGIQVSINDLSNGLIKLAGINVPIIHGEPLVGDIDYFEVSNSKVIKDLGLEFTKDFWGTLRSTLDDFLKYFDKVI